MDANLLVSADDASAPEHEIARPWFDGQLNGEAQVGIPWPSLLALAFVRLVSNPVVMRSPVTPNLARERAREWLALDNVWIPEPGTQHPRLLTMLLKDRGITLETKEGEGSTFTIILPASSDARSRVAAQTPSPAHAKNPDR